MTFTHPEYHVNYIFLVIHSGSCGLEPLDCHRSERTTAAFLPYFYSFILFLVAKQVELQLYTHIYTVYYYVVNKHREAVDKTTCAYCEY